MKWSGKMVPTLHEEHDFGVHRDTYIVCSDGWVDYVWMWMSTDVGEYISIGGE